MDKKNLETILKEEANDIHEATMKLKVGSEEHLTAVKSLVEVSKELNNSKKISRESEIAEQELICKNVEADSKFRESKNNKFKNYLAIGGLVLQFGMMVLAYSMHRDNQEFEKDGNVFTSSSGKSESKSLFPRLF